MSKKIKIIVSVVLTALSPMLFFDPTGHGGGGIAMLGTFLIKSIPVFPLIFSDMVLNTTGKWQWDDEGLELGFFFGIYLIIPLIYFFIYYGLLTFGEKVWKRFHDRRTITP